MDERSRPNSAAADSHSLDSRLRRGLEPARETVDRVVRRALSARPVAISERGVRLRYLAVGAGLLLLAVTAVGVFRVGDRPGGEGRTTFETNALPTPTISNASGRVVILVDGRTIWSDTGIGRRAAPVLEANGPVFFNSNGLVGVVLPHGSPRYLILGGER